MYGAHFQIPEAHQALYFFAVGKEDKNLVFLKDKNLSRHRILSSTLKETLNVQNTTGPLETSFLWHIPELVALLLPHFALFVYYSYLLLVSKSS